MSTYCNTAYQKYLPCQYSCKYGLLICIRPVLKLNRSSSGQIQIKRTFWLTSFVAVNRWPSLQCTSTQQGFLWETGACGLTWNLSLALHLTAIFPGEPRSASFIEAKDGGSGGDNWSYKSYKAPVKWSPPTNQHSTFYRPDALPVTQPTVSKHWRENVTLHGLANPKLAWGLPTLSLATNSSWRTNLEWLVKKQDRLNINQKYI